MTQHVYPVKKGEVVELLVEDLAFGGKGVARVEGYTVFVYRAIPGQRVAARITRRKRAFAEAVIEEVLAPSPDQVDPRCDHFGTCGGCLHQHYAYQAQLRAKRDQVAGCLRRLGGFADPEVEETLPAPDRYEYRNKMEYSFSPTRWLEETELERADILDRFGLGLHIRGRHDRVLNVERCHLQEEPGSLVLREVRAAAAATGLPAYSTRTHTGFWRFLVYRNAPTTGERMVNLITRGCGPGSGEAKAVEEIARRLVARVPGITSLLHSTSDRKAAIAVSDTVRVLHGEPVIRERLHGVVFEIGPNTFFQTHTAQAERLFDAAFARGGFTGDDTVWDLYCGAGALGLPLARRVARVVGVELVPEAVQAAERNARANGIDNAEFHAGDMKDILADRDLPRPDAVILDPPRDGVHASVVEAVVRAAPERVVYVSCNPASLARDLALFRDGGYEAGPVLPVDMFPHTAHVECVVALRRA